jgi:hypothetical protein
VSERTIRKKVKPREKKDLIYLKTVDKIDSMNISIESMAKLSKISVSTLKRTR